MIIDTIANIFDFISETNIVEEDFYHNKGVYPVYSGQTEDLGIVSYINTYSENRELITFTTYGNGAGKMFYRKGKCTIGRNCMGLVPKAQYISKINLEWFSYKFQSLLYKIRIGDITGQRSLNKLLLENVKIEIPSIFIQQKQLIPYKNASAKILTIEKILEEINQLIKLSLKVKSSYVDKIETIFSFEGGTGGLTEEFVYHHQPNSEEEKIKILSSATIEDTQMGFVSKFAKIDDKPIKIFSGESVLIARNGYAGSMKYFKNYAYTTNDHAYVMTVKAEWKNKINLRFVAYYLQPLFFNIVTSKSDNATFNKEYAELQTINLPNIQYQNSVGNLLVKLDKQKRNLELSMLEIDKLKNYEIV